MEALINLRQLDFPECVAKALEYLAASLAVKQPIAGVKDKNEEIFELISNEFIFGIFGGGKSKYSSLKEIQAVNVVLAFYSNNYDRAVMFAVFKHLFQNVSSNNIKKDFFAKVLSCAVNIQNKTFFEFTASWMQINGCGSDAVVSIVKSLLSDHYLGTSVTTSLRRLPSSSLLLTCHIITAITHIYSLTADDVNSQQLTSTMLELICDWMTYDPIVCLISLYPKYSEFLNSNQQILWTSPTKSNTQTAIPGLIKWCTRVPLSKISLQHSKLGLHKELTKNINTSSRNKSEIPEALWSRLFYLAIKTISIFPKIPGSQHFELFTVADMMHITQNVATICNSLQDKRKTNPDAENIVQLALNRVGQTLQMSLSTGAFRCCLADLTQIFHHLPQTKLMKIIQEHHNIPSPNIKE